jgi:hypothetical protein
MYQNLAGNDDNSLEKKIQPYTPICTKAELKKMLEANHKNKQYSKVEAVVDNGLKKSNKANLQAQKITNEESERVGRPISMYTALNDDPLGKNHFRINSGIPVLKAVKIEAEDSRPKKGESKQKGHSLEERQQCRT